MADSSHYSLMSYRAFVCLITRKPFHCPFCKIKGLVVEFKVPGERPAKGHLCKYQQKKLKYYQCLEECLVRGKNLPAREMANRIGIDSILIQVDVINQDFTTTWLADVRSTSPRRLMIRIWASSRGHTCAII